MTMNPMSLENMDRSEGGSEDEFYAEQQLELDERVQELREKDPERFKELEKLQAEFEASPEGKRLMHNARAMNSQAIMERQMQQGREEGPALGEIGHFGM